MTEQTYKAKLLAESRDCQGYTTYVFENLESDNWTNKYIMCVRFPNWDQSPFNIGEIGFLKVRSVEGGRDEWYNGTGFSYYRYTNDIFMKFVLEKAPVIVKEVILD